MKKTIYLLAILFIISYTAKTQVYRYIPDANFRTYLVSIACPFDASGDSLDISSPEVTTTTRTINCRGITMSNLDGVQYFENLDSLDCHGAGLNNIPSLPSNLKWLDCSANNLTSLPTLPSTLTILFTALNYNLNSLPALPDSILWLKCIANNLTMLPTLPSSLRYLECSANNLITLPVLPDSLQSLDCSYNDSIILPTLPIFLSYLNCSNNNLTILPSLPVFLTRLNCSNNYLTLLPIIPSSLLELTCDRNNIISLPSLPVSLSHLNCNNNNLTSLPIIPFNLVGLDCGGNNLSTIPILPSSLTYLWCWFNNLTTLPTLPSSLTSLNCSYNRSLSCLPYLPSSLTNVYFDSTSITCIPNNVVSATFSPPLGTFPYCNPSLHSCPSYISVLGTVYKDSNSNCSMDTIETKIKNITLYLQKDTNILQMSSTVINGMYAFNSVAFDTYTVHIDTTELPLYSSCLSSGYDTVIIDTSTHITSNLDMAMQCKTDFDIGTTGLVGAGLYRPASSVGFQIHAGDMAQVYGARCASVAGRIVLVYTGHVHYTGSTIGAVLPDTILPNRLVWNIANFNNLDFYNDLKPLFYIDSSAVAGDLLCFTTTVDPSSSDANPTNNIFSQCFIVRASYDPNIKEVSPAGSVTSSQGWMYYTIHFQNTGSSYAQNVYVWDSIDRHLNLNTIQIVGSSHNQQMEVYPNRVALFRFNDIFLQDSTTNEPESHGWVQYRIKLNTGLPEGIVINNTAGILFDLNTPIFTNTVETKICNTPTNSARTYIINAGQSVQVGTHIYTSTGIYTDVLTNTQGCDSIVTTTLTVISGIYSPKTVAISLYPNPTNDILNITIGTNQIHRVEVYDALGKKLNNIFLQQESVGSGQQNIQLHFKSLSSGIYFIRALNKENNVVGNSKFIKE